jgi:hypothetical protein
LSLPLLHLVESVRTVHEVNALAVAGGAALFVVATALIWAPAARPRLHTRRALRRVAPAAVWVLVAAALLPSLFPYDHLLPHTEHADEHTSVHASHCHESPGTCADAPLPSGPGELLSSAPLLAAPGLVAIAVATAALALRGLTVRPRVRPPLAVLSP